MKKRWLIGGVVILALAMLGTVLIMVLCDDAVEKSGVVEKPVEKFSLSAEMYGRSEVVEITAGEFDQLVAEKKSFCLLLHI